MSHWHELAHFLYDRGFWYADPLKEIDGLSEEQLLWVPDPNALCILWQVGHIAHREGEHIGRFLEGLKGELRPPAFEAFGTDWRSVDDLVASIDSVDSVLEWVRKVRKQSHEYIDTLTDADFHAIPPTSAGDLSVAHWLFVTACHTASHIGRIQLLRAMIEGDLEGPC